MNSESLAIQIIPDLTIDDKYTGIITDAQARIHHFTNNALEGNRLTEMFELERTKLNKANAEKVLKAEGKLLVGFQFETRSDDREENFQVFAKKVLPNGKGFKFYLTPTVQEIMLQLISLEDRRTVAIFSMLNSSMDVGYRILTTFFNNQLKRLRDKAATFIREPIANRLEKLKVAKHSADSGLWDDKNREPASPPRAAQADRPRSEDNLLQVMADDGTFEAINQFVESVMTRTKRIQEKRRRLEENPDMPREEIYEQMIKEDLDQLENCYARMHIYLKAYYKNKDKRTPNQNKVLRLFFAGQIEEITGDTSLLEDLLCLNQEDYFKNLDRHRALES